TDWLLMVISGNNLMINFMATLFVGKPDGALSIKSCTGATGVCIQGAEYTTIGRFSPGIARYLINRATSLPY
ncbi:hypothetical protein, partial [Klebsiella pneumoniae]|uniref:hypothetical protein n=1 Tax=Klebsiella pneumoniae TaxID=573 RepID=UPI001C6FCED8